MWYIKKDTFEVRDMTRREAAVLNRSLPPQEVWESGKNPEQILHSPSYITLMTEYEDAERKLERAMKTFKEDYINKNKLIITNFMASLLQAKRNGELAINAVAVFNLPFIMNGEGNLVAFNTCVIQTHSLHDAYVSDALAGAAWLQIHNGIDPRDELTIKYNKLLDECPDDPIKLIDALREGYTISPNGAYSVTEKWIAQNKHKIIT